MFRSGFIIIIVLYLSVILEVSSSVESTVVSKRVQKCRWYSPHVYLLGTPTCKISPKQTQAIEIEEFPHIAIIGYRDDDATVGIVKWSCHGTLVSSRYVLTIGHCAKHSKWTPVKVRLGANNIGYSSESNSSDYDIENIILHPLFNITFLHNIIGLIKLSRKVEFSENVRPVCLPDKDLMPSTVYQANYESTEEQNPVQRPLAIQEQRVEPNEQCNERFNKSSRYRDIITSELMCSLKPTNLSVNYSNVGESGAPLYIDHPDLACSHIQLGIGSFSLRHKTIKRFPRIATKVFYFIDWIESVIWAEGEGF